MFPRSSPGQDHIPAANGLSWACTRHPRVVNDQLVVRPAADIEHRPVEGTTSVPFTMKKALGISLGLSSWERAG